MDKNKKPEFDKLKASKIIGKYIIIGLTINDHNDKFIEQIQYHGIILEANENIGVKIALKGVHDGEIYTLPPFLKPIVPAKPGTYMLHSTNEEIENPDYQTTWIVNKPKPE
jgi:hypothetical protein